jgi:hypothetical protein
MDLLRSRLSSIVVPMKNMGLGNLTGLVFNEIG